MMIPLAILLAFVGLVAFYWALRSGQFDDVETPAQRVLFEEIKETKRRLLMSEIQTTESYDDKIVRNFAWATILWGIVGMLVGVIIAAELFHPQISDPAKELSFGRIRPLHTNAVIFAFVGNGIFMGFTTPFSAFVADACSPTC